jgi:hypothetical protein
MDLKSLAQLGRIEKEVEVNKELRVKLHTLSTIEQQIALSSVPEAVENVTARFTYLQVAVLIQATDAVNGESVTKEQAKELYDNVQYNILSEIFTAYSDVAGEQTKVMEELKKK